MKYLTLAAYLLLAPVAFAETVHIKNNTGGDPYEFYDQIKAFRKSGAKVIISGKCSSSCALYLHKEADIDVCVNKSAEIGFHSAYKLTEHGILDTSEHAKRVSHLINQIIYNGMPRSVQRKVGIPQKWPSVYNGARHNDATWIKGTDLKAFRICEDK